MATVAGLHELIAEAVVATIQNLGLADNGNILPVYELTTTMDVSVLTYPCIIVAFEGLSEEEGAGDFEDQQVNYPVHVVVADRAAVEDVKRRPLILGWRKQVMDIFRPLTTFTNLPQVQNVRVKPGVIVEQYLPKLQYFASGCVVWADTFEAYQHP